MRTTALALLLTLSATEPAAARGPPCGASCVTWAFPLVVAAGSALMILVAGYHLLVAVAPHLGTREDIKRGRMRNAAIGTVLALLGSAGITITVQVYL